MSVSSGEEPLEKQTAPIEIPDSQCVKDAVIRLMMAKNPVILAGSSAVRNSASKAMVEFVNKLHIPVIHTMMAKGIIPFDNPYCCLLYTSTVWLFLYLKIQMKRLCLSTNAAMDL